MQNSEDHCETNTSQRSENDSCGRFILVFVSPLIALMALLVFVSIQKNELSSEINRVADRTIVQAQNDQTPVSFKKSDYADFLPVGSTLFIGPFEPVDDNNFSAFGCANIPFVSKGDLTDIPVTVVSDGLGNITDISRRSSTFSKNICARDL